MTKHIDVRLHFVIDVFVVGKVSVKKFLTDINPIDILTEFVSMSKFRVALDLLKACSI